MTVAKDFEEFFASCNKHNVEYLVVGGYAFAVHAHPRYTGDMDVFVRATEENARRVMAALKDFGFSSPSLTWQDLSTTGRVVQIGYPPLRIDLISAIDGVRFEEAWGRRVESTYGQQKIYIISKEDLITKKRASGRKQDLLDLEDLARVSWLYHIAIWPPAWAGARAWFFVRATQLFTFGQPAAAPFLGS